MPNIKYMLTIVWFLFLLSTANAVDPQNPQEEGFKPVTFIQSVSNTTPYVGQAITYIAEVAGTQEFVGGNIEELEPRGFLKESHGERGQSRRNSGAITINSFTETLYPLQTGELTIPERNLKGRLRVTYRQQGHPRGFPFGDIFDDGFIRRFSMEHSEEKVIAVMAKPLTINVRPLPPSPFSIQGYVPVGNLEARYIIEPEVIAENESTTLSLKVSGNANLKPLDMPSFKSSLSGLFRNFDEKPQLTKELVNGTLKQTKLFKTTLVPEKSGELTLPDIEIPYFDTELGKYISLRVPGKKIVVTPSFNTSRHLGQNKQSQNITEKPEKNSIEPKNPISVGSDLLAQHVGADTLITHTGVNDILKLIVFIFSPALFFFLIYCGQNQNSQNKRRIVDRGYVKALSTLDGLKNSNSVDEVMLRFTLLSYFKTAFDAENMSLTTIEVRSELKKLGLDNSDLLSVLSLLDTAIFGNSKISIDEFKKNIDICISSLKAIHPQIQKQIQTRKNATTLKILPLVVLVFLLPISFSHAVDSIDPHQVDSASSVIKANTFYDEGNFSEAARYYEKALNTGLINGHVFYNLGNAYFRLGNRGKAIASFRRALKLLPRDPDIKANLEFVRMPTNSIQLTNWRSSFLKLPQYMSIFEIEYVIIILYFVAFVCLSVKYFTEDNLSQKLSGRIGLILLCLSLALYGLSAYASTQTSAVTVSDNVKVFSGNSMQFQVIYVLDDGFETEVQEVRDSWIRILLPEGRTGWVDNTDRSLELLIN